MLIDLGYKTFGQTRPHELRRMMRVIERDPLGFIVPYELREIRRVVARKSHRMGIHSYCWVGVSAPIQIKRLPKRKLPFRCQPGKKMGGLHDRSR